jgi:hypothetical protein
MVCQLLNSVKASNTTIKNTHTHTRQRLNIGHHYDSGAVTKIIFMTFCCIAERRTKFTNRENKRKSNGRAQNLHSQKEIVLKTRIGNKTIEVIQ